MNLDASLAENLVGIVEFGRLGKMRNVAGVDNEGRFDRHRLYLGDSFAQRAKRIRVRRLVETDVAIAHLQKGESSGLCGKSVANQSH
jgi:hypothetical protein